jgi:glycine cleavage system H protein
MSSAAKFSIPETLSYTVEHEWTRSEGDVYTVGITDYAQDALGDVTFVELPPVGRQVQAGGTFGVVESVKTYSDLYAPVSGEVVEVNEAVVADPSSVNREPYGGAWLVRIRATSAPPALLDAAAYRAHLEKIA